MVTAVLFDFKRRVCKPVPSVSLVAQRFGVSMVVAGSRVTSCTQDGWDADGIRGAGRRGSGDGSRVGSCPRKSSRSALFNLRETGLYPASVRL